MAGTEPGAEFKKETVSKLLGLFFREERTKAGSDAVYLMAEIMKVFVVEAGRRAMKQAENEDCDRVDLEHVEKILPQLAHLILIISSLPSSPLRVAGVS